MAAERKYDVQSLNIGDSRLIEWVELSPGQRMNAASQRAIYNAVRREEKKGKKFKREPRGAGLLVTRIE